MKRAKAFKHKQQKGLALITVMVVVALVSIIATQMSSTGHLSARLTGNITTTEQAYFYARGLEEFGIAMLQLSLEKENGKKAVHLNQQWALQKIAFPIEEDGELVGSLAGEIIDLNNCFNVNAILVNKKSNSAGGNGPGGNNAEGGKPNGNLDPDPDPEPESTPENDPDYHINPTLGQEFFASLINNIGLPEDTEFTSNALAAILRDWVDPDVNPNGADGAEDTEYMGYAKPYRTGNAPLSNINELLVLKGYSREVVDALKPYICALPVIQNKLPEAITINVNTLKPESALLLSSIYTDLSQEKAREIIENRPEDGYDASTFDSALKQALTSGGSGKSKPGTKVVFRSEYFELRADVSYGRGIAKLNVIVHSASVGQGFQILQRYFGEPLGASARKPVVEESSGESI